MIRGSSVNLTLRCGNGSVAGNAEGALGDWDGARRHYLMAANDPDLSAIAAANYALASFEAGDSDGAVKSARQLLRRCVVSVKLLTSRQHSLMNRPCTCICTLQTS